MMKKWFLRSVVALILFLSMQGPELIAQYVDHLTGHVEELKYQVGKLKELTGKEDNDLKPLLAQWVQRAEPKEPALFISALYTRFEKLKQDLLDFRGANFWSVPFVFLSHFDGDILHETLENYRFGFSLTWAVLPFLALGALLGSLLYLPTKLSNKKEES